MPNSKADHNKKYREKRKLRDPDFQKNENLRISALKRAKKESMTARELEELRTRERDKKRRQRELKRSQASSEPQTSTSLATSGSSSEINDASKEFPYKCPQTASKAILKAVRSLPTSPKKRDYVIKGLCHRYNIKLCEDMRRDLDCEDEDLTTNYDESLVKRFYFRPDIVYTGPGIKDSMISWKNGSKEKLQKYYLTMFLREAYFIFKQENPTAKIGYSKFCELRPENVFLLKDTPKDQCRCKIHENFILKLKGLKISYGQSFWDTVLCDSSCNSSCWQNSCDSCSDLKNMDLPQDMTQTIVWKQWEQDSSGRLKLVLHENVTAEIWNTVKEEYQKFLSHVNLKRIQSSEFEKDKKCLNTRILQIDFAMSFSCEYQNEIQSALWARSSVLLFTAALFYRGQCKTFVICSDSKNKDKDTIFVFVNHLYELIFNDSDNTMDETKDIIWSDGPASEFKNKYMVKLLNHLSRKFNKVFCWKYSATSHGKGVVDGVGGNVKRLVKEKMLSQAQNKVVIQSAEDFFKVASDVVKTTKIFYITQSEITQKNLEFNPWANVKPIQGISNFHVIICDSNQVTAKKHAFCEGFTTFNL